MIHEVVIDHIYETATIPLYLCYELLGHMQRNIRPPKPLYDHDIGFRVFPVMCDLYETCVMGMQ